MNILATSFSLATNSLDIYLAGCKGPHCSNCHNPESWDFDSGVPCTKSKLKQWTQFKFHSFPELIDNIFVMGGEPLDQPKEDLHFLLHFLARYEKPIWLFTHYDLTDIPFSTRILCDYIKTGRYDETKLNQPNLCYGIQLASGNQKVHKKGVDY